MMKTILIALCIAINSSLLIGQTPLTIERTTVNNTETGMWEGVNIQRSVPTAFTYRNNSVTSVNASGYLLQAGDEGSGSSNNNLQGEIITGNRFSWNGTDAASITHGIFTGHNMNAVVKYNYLNKVPMSIIRKSSGMTNTSGGVAYNIVNDATKTAVVCKGMSGVLIYNNTFYSTRSATQTGWRGIVDIYPNDSYSTVPPSQGTKIKNNIFYTRQQTYNIAILTAADAVGFESDYNIFWCEAGTPMFRYLEADKTFAQWQALGYDQHSRVLNPNFIDLINFVPAVRLDYGINLGATWQNGLSTAAVWTVGNAPANTNQNGTWQVGARIYDATSINPGYVGSVVENASPTTIEMTFNLNLANILPSNSAFNVLVNSVASIVNSVSISGNKVKLTLASAVKFGNNVTVSYIKPATNPLQTASGGQAASITSQLVKNNIITPPVDVTPAKTKMSIHPNPVHRIINILFEYTGTSFAPNVAASKQMIRIFDISGKLFIEKLIVAGVTIVRIPINLKPGIYNILMYVGDLNITSQRMIVY